MEGRPERVADYFLVVGAGKNTAPFHIDPMDEGESLHLRPSEDPVTDIVIIHKKHESCPKGYRCIESTPKGYSASLTGKGLFSSHSLLLCYRQGKDRPPITEISIYTAEHNRQFPHGHEAIAVTIAGRSADLSGGGKYPSYLTMRKGNLHGHATAITDLKIITEEDPPQGYKPLPTPLGRGLMASPIRLCYKTSLIGPPSIPFTPEILSRFPVADHPEFPLPESVPLFCFPFGVSVEHWDRHASFPIPTFLTFALTGATGNCMYGACVVFYEQVLPSSDAISSIREAFNVTDSTNLHISKCICILSHWPFFSAFKYFLSSLYRLSISRNVSLPLERYVANLLFDVPFPSVERPQVQMVLGPEMIVFSLPMRTNLPMRISTHWTLLACLDPGHCVTLLHLMLLEQKIVLHSSRPALLTAVGEALRSILFPLQWQCTYIPMCPLAFASYLQAPVPYIIGMDSRYFESYMPPPDVCVVDLDTNTLTLSDISKRLLSANPLPKKEATLLRKSLTVLVSEVSNWSVLGDFAVAVVPIDFSETYKADQERVDLAVREAFLKFSALLLGNYRSCLRPLKPRPLNNTSTDVSDLIDLEHFLSQRPVSERPFFSCFFDTQIFTSFVEQRSFSHSESTSLTFFDECTEKVAANHSVPLLKPEMVARKFDLPTLVTPPPDESGLPPHKTYMYSTFPALDPTLFCSPLRESRARKFTPPLPRSPSNYHSTISVSVRTRAEKAKNKSMLERAAGSDVLWADALLSQACSLWYMLLPAHLRSQWNKGEVLSQALDLLDTLRSSHALPNDEVCYRVLMEQCVQLGRPMLAVQVYSEMVKAGIHPSAVTYGFYNKALMEGQWPSTNRHWKVVKIVFYACFYLRALQREAAKRGADAKQRSIISMAEWQANFRLIRTRSFESSTEIRALDLGEEHKEHAVAPTIKRRSSGWLHRSSVYRLCQLTDDENHQGEYAVMGDSLYIADKFPCLALPGDIISKFRPRPTGRPGNWASRRKGAMVEVVMCSSVECPKCHQMLYDEDVMVCWSMGMEEYNISCPYCGMVLVPSLSIRVIKKFPCPKKQPEHPENESPVHRESGSSEEEKRPPTITTPENGTTSPLSSCRTEPIHRKTLSVSHITKDREDDGESSGSAQSPDRTSPIKKAASEFPAGELTPKRIDEVVEENDFGLSDYVAALRARGHRRVYSAPQVVPSVPNKSNTDSAGSSSPSSATKTRTSFGRSELVEHTEIHSVPYLSPIVLRKELESLISQGKGELLHQESLLTDRPIIYWNLVWLFTRLQLPTYLPLLALRHVTKAHPGLRKLRVQMYISTLWDKTATEGSTDSLHHLWLRNTAPELQLRSENMRRVFSRRGRRDSISKLQSLVAHMQCGELMYIIHSLLADRMAEWREKPGRNSVPRPPQRSLYRQLLFLKCTLCPKGFDVATFDQQFQSCLQKLPKEFAVLLQAWDHAPGNKAACCRKVFGPLQVQ